MTDARPYAAFWIAVPIILGIGWLDYVTGPELGLSMFYLLPIAAVAWRGRYLPAIFLAQLAAACWIVADLMVRQGSLVLPFWNGLTRVVIYTATAYLVARVRLDQEQLGSMNARLEEALERESRLARTDAVTDLPNGRAFLEQLQRELARARRDQHPVSILYADLDGFKAINDRYGHAAGDLVLRRVADAMRESVRAGDTVARMGGDEFCGVLWKADAGAATHVVDRIASRVEQIAADYPAARLGISIGVVEARTDETDAEHLLARADALMYARKPSRRLDRQVDER